MYEQCAWLTHPLEQLDSTATILSTRNWLISRYKTSEDKNCYALKLPYDAEAILSHEMCHRCIGTGRKCSERIAIAKKIKTPRDRSFVSGDRIAFIVRSGERSRLRRDSTYKSARAFPSYQHCKLIMREERRGPRRRKKKHLCDPMTPSGY